MANTKRIAAVVLITLIICGVGQLIVPGDAKAKSGLSWLHTDGSQIKTSTGQVVVLRGVTWIETLWRYPSLTNWAQRADRAKALGVTVVRLALNPSHWSDSDYVPTIDNIVSLLAQRQIYVTLDFHEAKEGETYDDIANHIVNNSPVGPFSNWLDFVKTLASRYKGQPNATFIEFFGQPPHETDRYPASVLGPAYYNSILQAARQVHSINPNVLVTFGGLNSGGVGQAFIDNPLPEPNVVYGIHRYYHFDIGYSPYAKSYASGQFALARQQMEQLFLQIGLVMLQKGHAVILAEFGADNSDPNWITQIQDVYSLMAKYSVGWVQWDYSAPLTDSFSLTFNGNRLSLQGQVCATYLAA